MKKIFAFITALLILGCVVFAEVTVKALGDGNAEVTFFYGNPKAADVTVVGDFTNWAAGAIPMTKVEKGWEYKTTVPMATTMKYKWLTPDGIYTFDIKAPDFLDDGYGGKNGVVDVAKLVAVEAAKATGDTAALEKLSAAGLKFGTFTQVDLVSNFITRNISDPEKKGFEGDNVQIKAKSYWKISGEIVKNMPVFIEIKAFDTTKTLWQTSPTGASSVKLDKGMNDFATGMLFNPFNYLNDGTPPSIGHFKAGLNTSYVNLESGYKYAKPSKRSTIIWETVTDKDAGDGYFQFSNGAMVQQFGDVKLDVAIVPNKTLTNMGARSWLSATYKGAYTIETQWDVKSLAVTQNASEFFEEFTGNAITGAKAVVGPVTVKGQFSIPTATDTVKEATAWEASVAYTVDQFGVTAKSGKYDPNAAMLYGKSDDVAGNAGKATFFIDPWMNVIDGAKVGIESKLATTYKYDLKLANVVSLKPYVNIDLAKVAGMNMTADAYAKMDVNNSDGVASKDKFKFNELGLHFGMPELVPALTSLDVNYAIRNEDVKMFNSLLVVIGTKPGINGEVGLGIRTITSSDATAAQKNQNEALAFSLGANYKVKALKDGVFFGAFVYNMDPYDDMKDNLKLDGYRADKSIDDFAGKAQFRMGMKWDF